MGFGEIISALRAEKGIYQKELADYLQVSIGTISNYEQGIHNPDFDTLCKIADFYEVSLDYLLGRTNIRACVDRLDQKLTENYTMADLMNITLQLDAAGTHSLVEYVNLLMLKQGHQEESE